LPLVPPLRPPGPGTSSLITPGPYLPDHTPGLYAQSTFRGSSPPGRAPRGPQGPASHTVGGERQRERKARTLTDRAVTTNGAVVLADDAVRDRQPQTCAAPDRLGREKRIVNAGQLLGRNARAGVRNLRHGPVAVDTGRYRQPAATRHRVTGVQEQVQKDLLELMFNPQYGHLRLRQIAADLDLRHLELV